jgi:hypothetical protein
MGILPRLNGFGPLHAPSLDPDAKRRPECRRRPSLRSLTMMPKAPDGIAAQTSTLDGVMAMNVEPATEKFLDATGSTFAMKNTTRSRSIRQASFVLAVGVALAVAACTGGAGLDVPIGPVDHSCGGEPSSGSGCDTR